MRARRIPTIRSSLVWLVLACIVPASLMVVGLLWYDYRQDRERVVQESTATARAIASAVDRDLAGMQAALLALATSPYLASDDLAAFYQQANELLKQQNTDNIVLLDAKGQQIINTLRPFGSTLPAATNPALRQVFKTGQPAVATSSGAGTTRVRAGGRRAGLPRRHHRLCAGGRHLAERLSGLLTQQRLAADQIGVIYDSTGIVARTNQTDRVVGKRAPPT